MRRPLKKKRIIQKDEKYKSQKVGKLVNYILERGKKDVARKIVYSAFNEIEKKEKRDSILVFEEALQNVAPLMELRSRRIGGANYQIPQEVSENRRLTLALRWIIKAAKSKKGGSMYKHLSEEIISASKNEGTAVLQRENTQKMAEANRAFAHLAW